MLILKLTDSNRKTYNNFVWPEHGPVECCNWDPLPVCGGGLHGWANGCGPYLHAFNEGVWLVVDVPDDTVISLDDEGHVKFPRGDVVYCGSREGAVKYLIQRGALNTRSNPALACFTTTQLVEITMRSANRAVRVHAPSHLRANGLFDLADLLAALPKLVDKQTTDRAACTARTIRVGGTGRTVAVVNAAAAAADYAALAFRTGSVFDVACVFNYTCTSTGNYACTEREYQRLDKLQMLGLM